jgi:zinc/manganese transport system substrate-binding protein
MRFLPLAAAMLALVQFVPLRGALAADRVNIVAAENFYGDLARQIGGDHVTVTSILANPDEDPHLFETSPSTARAVADAAIVIYNGAGYDPWMEKLISASPAGGRTAIVAAGLTGRKEGDNPHLWYDPATMPAVAKAIATKLAEADPDHKADYDTRLATVEASLKAVADKAAKIKGKYAGAPVTASEPVFGYMAEALGLTMRNERFQLSVMNDTEPSARDVAAFETDLKEHKVKVLFYNSQTTDPQTEKLLALAHEGNVPVVGVSETEPAGKSYSEWMLDQLDATEKALAGPSS